MNIYIASSWKNQHGVEMLTAGLRRRGYTVTSWIENNFGEKYTQQVEQMGFENWVQTEAAQKAFEFDTEGAQNCDLFIYYGPAGKDACAEMGIAWASNIPIFGLYAKGEDIGLMRLMARAWYMNVADLLSAIHTHEKQLQG